MLDLSPEKLMVLLLVAVVVVGPHRLPATARTLASGLVRARRLAGSFTQPVHDTLQEPRRILNDALADLRTTAQEGGPSMREPTGLADGLQQPDATASPTAAPHPIEYLPADPDLN
jgi:Sec-independent protein translocase protein TatA